MDTSPALQSIREREWFQYFSNFYDTWPTCSFKNVLLPTMCFQKAC